MQLEVYCDVLCLSSHLQSLLWSLRDDVLEIAAVHGKAMPVLMTVLCWDLHHPQLEPRWLSSQECIYSKSEELIEYVPEALKNLLLVMASRGILTEQWRVRVCHMADGGRREEVRIAELPSLLLTTTI